MIPKTFTQEIQLSDGRTITLETGKLAKERADAAAKIKKAAAEKAEARLASEAAAEAAEIKPEDVSVDAKTQETVAEAKGEA